MEELLVVMQGNPIHVLVIDWMHEISWFDKDTIISISKKENQCAGSYMLIELVYFVDTIIGLLRNNSYG